MMYGTGHIATPKGHMMTSARLLGGTPATEANISPFLVKRRFDQGPSSSCEGNGFAGASYCALGAAGTPLSFVPSQDDAYRNGRAIDRTPNPDGSLPSLTDSGAMTNQVVRAVSEWGIRPMGPLASDGRYSDVDMATVNREPTLADLEADAQHLVVGEYAITSWGKQMSDDVASCLSIGVPVILAIAGGSQAFQAYSGGVMGALNAPNDHCVFLYGFTTTNGTRTFLGVNSWSESWGENGLFRISEPCLYQCGDLTAMKVSLR